MKIEAGYHSSIATTGDAWRSDVLVRGLPRIMVKAHVLYGNGAALFNGLGEIIEDVGDRALVCQRAGASGISLRLHDEAGRLSRDAEFRRAIMMEVGYRTPGLYLQLALENIGHQSLGDLETLLATLQPDAVSLALADMVSCADLGALSDFYHRCWAAGIDLQHVLRGEAEVFQLAEMIDDGIVPEENLKVLIEVESQIWGDFSAVEPAAAAIRQQLPDSDWALGARGPGESACLYAAMMLGGKVRIDCDASFSGAPHGQGPALPGGRINELVQMLGLDNAGRA
ncbi:3-keto-5-aminohexanoate cleavage protein [Martelella alba]|uniref:3-keto-5-aminohexanoate cleavage protein n=1 Tax=Martelella alba TaxID=2590451 RepID=A0A506U6X0_9HYPH|nr:3-keto-5-aminohexanoate cleavage protein [Martelella alba]TPW29248.1 3-keto-5-aminohexanoate cleavage protein [Martelella alba]